MARRKKTTANIVYPPEPAPDVSDLPQELEQAIDKAIAQSLTTEPGELPPYMRTTTARQAFQSAFETVGGMPRLAIWANKNYGRFLQLYSRMLPLTLAGDEEHPIRVVAPWLTPQRFGQGDIIEGTNVVAMQQPVPIQQQLTVEEPAEEGDWGDGS